MRLEPRYKKVILEMQGKVKTLSQKATYEIDHKLAMALKPIKEEFYRKEKSSRDYLSRLELSAANI